MPKADNAPHSAVPPGQEMTIQTATWSFSWFPNRVWEPLTTPARFGSAKTGPIRVPGDLGRGFGVVEVSFLDYECLESRNRDNPIRCAFCGSF